ncbi:sodium-dependent transporter [candidate division KSB1 bacterium]|nr:sodium-dependent transporter [candidate division KSB1 bacterium]
MENQGVVRGVWSSKFGFIMAAAGSAIGLGNIWRFPYLTGIHGGAAFVLVYLGFVLLLGLPIMLNELILGRHTQRNPFGAINMIASKGQWKMIGALGVVTGFAILSFYLVVAGWTLGYFVKLVEWGLKGNLAHQEFTSFFNEFVHSPFQNVGYMALFCLLTILVVYGGVKDGIERWSKILMPLLFALLLVVIIRAITLKGAGAGIEFYLKPDFSKITGDVLIAAMGQAFFSLSLGMGAMLTYGSYLTRKDNLVTSALSVCIFDTFAAFLAGLAIFPAVFALGHTPSQGPNLIFVVLPAIFKAMPLGLVVGPLFFILLVIAALTSTVSLLEVVAAYFIDEKGWSRRKAVLFLGGACLLVSIPVALSFGISPGLSNLPWLKVSLFDLLNKLFSDYSLPIGALLLALLVGWKWGIPKAVAEASFGNAAFNQKARLKFKVRNRRLQITTADVWGFLIRFIAPVAIFILLFDSLKISANYRTILLILGVTVLDVTLLWLVTRGFARAATTPGAALVVTLWRGLILVVVAPLLQLIPVIGSVLIVTLAISLSFFLFKLILHLSGQKLIYTVGMVSVIEGGLFAIISLYLLGVR